MAVVATVAHHCPLVPLAVIAVCQFAPYWHPVEVNLLPFHQQGIVDLIHPMVTYLAFEVLVVASSVVALMTAPFEVAAFADVAAAVGFLAPELMLGVFPQTTEGDFELAWESCFPLVRFAWQVEVRFLLSCFDQKPVEEPLHLPTADPFVLLLC